MLTYRRPHIIRSVNGVTELNKNKVRLFVEAVWNQGQLELIDELVATDYIGHIPCIPGGILGRAGVRQLVSSHRRAHPNLHLKIENQIAEEDLVVMRWQATAAPPQARGASAPSGDARCYEGISIIRLLGGKQVDAHTEMHKLHSAPGQHTLAIHPTRAENLSAAETNP